MVMLKRVNIREFEYVFYAGPTFHDVPQNLLRIVKLKDDKVVDYRLTTCGKASRRKAKRMVNRLIKYLQE